MSRPAGASNTSTASNPLHVYPANGQYTVTLIVDYYCGGGSDTLSQVVNINVPCITVASTSITCANLGSATVTAVNGIGPFSYTWAPVSQTGSVATGLSPGTYTVYLFDAGNNITSTATATFASPVPLTGSLVASTSLICHGASNGSATVINIAGGSATQSYLWSNGNTTFNSSGVTSLTAGTWSVTVTDNLTACQVHSVFVISQPPALSLQITGPGPVACLQSLVTLTGTASGGTPFNNNGYTLAWLNGPSVNGASVTTYSVIQNSNGLTIYSLSVTDANGCQQVASYSVSVVSTLSLSVSSASICPFQTGTLTVSGANSYTWSTSVTGFSMAASPAVTTVYTVTGEAPGCVSTATGQILLKPIPVPVPSANAPLCSGKDLVLQAGTTGATFIWIGPNSFTSGLATPTITNLGALNSGAYSLTVTAVNGCTALATLSLTVNPTPSLSVSGSTVCAGEQATLCANSVPNVTYLWTGTSFQSTQTNPVFLNAQIGQTGSYTVVVTSGLGCTNSAVAQLSVAAAPVLNVSLSSSSICAQALNGSPNTITLTSTGANTYTLSTSPDVSSTGNPPWVLGALPPYQASTGSATLYGSNGVCTVSTTANFSILPNPTVTVSNPTPVICAGESFTYTSQGANSYTWSNTTPNFTTYNNGGVAVAHPSINSVFSVFGSMLGCNSASKTYTIAVNQLPSISVSPSSTFVCRGQATTLNAAGTANNFTWSPAQYIPDPFLQKVQVSPLSLQQFTVIGSANNCTNSAVATVSVYNLPVPFVADDERTFCMKEDVRFAASGGERYQWKGPVPLIYFEGPNVQFNAASSLYAGNYTLTVTDKFGCAKDTLITIQLLDLPDATLITPTQIACVPFCSGLTVSNSTAITASWVIDNHTYAQNTFTYCVKEPGDYVFKSSLTDNLSGCKNSTSFTLTGLPVPEADFRIVPEHPVEMFDEVRFLNNTNESTTDWQWNFFINNQTKQIRSENASMTFDDAGIYPVAFVVENSHGCKDTIIKNISIEEDALIYIPDVFTPNGDDLNDLFLPVTRGISNYSMEIFDRWGALIFATTNVPQGWDGTYRGEVCKQDVYVYRIIVRSTTASSKEYTGKVTLVR